jgi:Tetratricopeptide repeat
LAAAHWRLAQVLEKEQRRSEAVTELKSALRQQPDFLEAKQGLKRPEANE